MFGWFKKDTSLTKDDQPKDDAFIFEWEEEEAGKENKKKPVAKKKATPEKKKKKKKGLGKFIDKIAEPDDEEYEDFDDI